MYCMLMLFSSSFWTSLVAVFERHTSQILNFGGHALFYVTHGTAMVRLWYGYGTLMARLWYDNPDVNVHCGMITRMSILVDCLPLGEEASFPNLEGK